jgi:three-Cys-motif partner protein
VTANDKFFQKKQAAAVLKHGILRRYPPVFATMTGSTSKNGRVVYLDGYAGPGRYTPEPGEEHGADGSPVLAIKTAETISAWKRDMHCVFVERDPAHADNLLATLAAEAPGSLGYSVLKGDLTERLSDALAIAGDAPLLAFLDPFGTALPYEELVARLLGRSARLKTEVLLNFNLEMVWRIGGLLTAENQDTTDLDAGKVATLARIDAFLGGIWWQETFRAARANATDHRRAAAWAAERVAEEFCRKVAADTSYGSFTVPIRRRPQHPPLFMMILFFRHPAAPYQFNQAASGANEDWRHHLHKLDLEEELARVEDGMLFGSDLVVDMVEQAEQRAEQQLQDQWTRAIAENIKQLAHAGHALSVQDRTAALYGTTLGLAREMHLRRAWDMLAEQGAVQARDKKTKIRLQAIRGLKS